jgi:hypothetical protein
MNNQQQMIFDYLKQHKSATGLELLRNCGTLSYTKRISELRRLLANEGYLITGEFIKVKTRFNGWQKVKQYTLVKVSKKKTVKRKK